MRGHRPMHHLLQLHLKSGQGCVSGLSSMAGVFNPSAHCPQLSTAKGTLVHLRASLWQTRKWQLPQRSDAMRCDALSVCHSEMAASPRLLLALEETSVALARLASVLDAVAFRNVWRGFATSVNKLLYNDVATEAHFSPQVAPPCCDVATSRPQFESRSLACVV